MPIEHKGEETGGKETREVKRWRYSGLAVMVGVVMVAGTAGAAEEGWHLEITPYVWFANIDGTVTVGDKKADFSADFSDLIDKIDVAGELMAVASCDRWVVFAQADYFAMSQDFSKAPGGELDGNEFLLTGTAGYRFDGFSNGSTIEVLGGVRCVWNKSKVEVDGMGSNRDTSDLVDGIVMVRPSLPLSVIWEKLENLRLNPTFSIGAGESDLVWEVQPELQYQFSDRVAARAGYRRLQYKFSDGPADVDVGFQGFLVGFGVTL